MNAILTKLRDFIGLNESEEYDYYEEEASEDDFQSLEPEETTQALAEPRQTNRRHRDNNRENSSAGVDVGMIKQQTPARSNVIGMPGIANGLSEVVIIEPHSFEEMPQVIQTLRERRSVVLNLNVMDPEEAQRAVDFVAGGTYALDGHQERIGESIFLFAPSCVKVTTLSGALQEMVAPPAENPIRPATIPNQVPAWAPESTRIAQ